MAPLGSRHSPALAVVQARCSKGISLEITRQILNETRDCWSCVSTIACSYTSETKSCEIEGKGITISINITSADE